MRVLDMCICYIDHILLIQSIQVKETTVEIVKQCEDKSRIVRSFSVNLNCG